MSFSIELIHISRLKIILCRTSFVVRHVGSNDRHRDTSHFSAGAVFLHLDSALGSFRSAQQVRHATFPSGRHRWCTHGNLLEGRVGSATARGPWNGGAQHHIGN